MTTDLIGRRRTTRWMRDDVRTVELRGSIVPWSADIGNPDIPLRMRAYAPMEDVEEPGVGEQLASLIARIRVAVRGWL